MINIPTLKKLISVYHRNLLLEQIFSLYCSSLYKVLEEDVNIHGFADDHSIKTQFQAGNLLEEQIAINKLTDSFHNIMRWMSKM